MDSPMIRATWQTGLLSAISNILGQAIRSYQATQPFTIDTFNLITFVLFSILQCPPNFAWQKWLERKYPGHTTTTALQDADKKSPPQGDKKRNVGNTLIKFALDQTLGAAFNTVIFLVSMDLLRGNSVEFALQHCRRDFWKIMWAGYKMWPAVSITSFLVIPVDQRVVFGSIAGLFWGVYLSLLSSSK